ncbi:hypothetical protein K737_300208 [Holospora undulata HU1]|uniref:Uncharacterized protein n=1 Tax=Holospora undulata HU1 TaxID=1321371 RepID=A0A061JGT5_9PROT|nr:hypothetical protein K737_300208 [Holospora undulata HU1]
MLRAFQILYDIVIDESSFAQQRTHGYFLKRGLIVSLFQPFLNTAFLMLG